jgi:predicted enzyme related to lactoylglutathione lyase
VADPLEALRLPVTPVDPDPHFAVRLRARLERALALPKGVTPMTTTANPATQAATAAQPTAGAAIPYLAVAGARRALDWYRDVFDARVVGEPIVMPDDRIGHAELRVGAGMLYLADEHPEIGVVAPAPDVSAVTLVLSVPDADATVRRASDAGAQITREPADAYGARMATLVDPFGHRWMVQTPLPAPAAQPAQEPSRHGDMVYATMVVPNAERGASFYAAVLGWNIGPGERPGTYSAEGVSPMVGVSDCAALGPDQPQQATMLCCYHVDDIPTAVRWVREAGGTAGDPVPRPFGTHVDCIDDQGTAFYLYQPPAGETGGPRPALNGNRHGDLSYLTLQVADSAKARAFYGAVLGWSFTRGRVEDGWQVAEVAPMTGLSGGHPHADGVPMWKVDDIEAAAARVRAAGGSAGDVSRQAYGLSAECTDDQGSKFYLGQL